MSPFMRVKRTCRANPGSSVFVQVLDAGMRNPSTRCGGGRPKPGERRESSRSTQFGGRGARGGDLHVAEAARTGAALEERGAEQPDAHDRLGWAADVLLVVRIDVT